MSKFMLFSEARGQYFARKGEFYDGKGWNPYLSWGWSPTRAAWFHTAKHAGRMRDVLRGMGHETRIVKEG